MSKRTFSQPRPPEEGFLEVTLEGYYQLDDDRPTHLDPPQPAKKAGDEWTEEYRFLRHAPFSETGNLVASFGTNDAGKMTVNQLNITRFLLRAVHPDDRTRLATLLDDQRRVLTTEQVTGLAMYIVEVQNEGKASTT